MKIIVAAIAFAITIGILVWTGNNQSNPKQENNYAQILQQLAQPTETAYPTPQRSVSRVTTPVATVYVASVTPKQSQNSNTILLVSASPVLPSTTLLIPLKTITPTPTPASTPKVTPTPQTPTPSILKTPTPTPSTPTPTPTPMPSPTPTPTPIPSAAETPTPAATLTPDPQNLITIASMTPTVQQKGTAQFNISTLPEAQCKITVTLPSGSKSTATGISNTNATKTAGVIGIITWSWDINWNTKIGTAKINLSCSKDGQTFSGYAQMEITASQ